MPRLHFTLCLFVAVLLAACFPAQALLASPPPTSSQAPYPTVTSTPTPTFTQSPPLTPTTTPRPLVPNFAHVIILVFENREFGFVIGNNQMPNYNRWAGEYTLLTQYYAITHPSLPNYIALMGGDTFGIDRTCSECFVNASSLPDQIEASGRTWKGYFEDMPRPCYVGDTDVYVQKHNPFIYFDPIRLDEERCPRSVVPLTELVTDLAAGPLPDFVFIVPNQCNNAHDCDLPIADAWLGYWVPKLMAVLNPKADTEPYLIVLTWDEGQGNHSCCGLPAEAGGRVATVLISPLAKNGFHDDTPYTHYSLLKTIEEAWGLPYLGHALDENNVLITAPWK
jgi:phospholipase C